MQSAVNRQPAQHRHGDWVGHVALYPAWRSGHSHGRGGEAVIPHHEAGAAHHEGSGRAGGLVGAGALLALLLLLPAALPPPLAFPSLDPHAAATAATCRCCRCTTSSTSTAIIGNC
jgi:hypothetical protein